MPLPTWPATLPQKPLDAGYGERPMPNVSSFTPEMSVPMTRRKYTGASKLQSWSLVLEPGQVELFELWFKEELGDGAKVFTWAHWRDGSRRKFKFSPDDPYSLSSAGPHEELSINLFQLPG